MENQNTEVKRKKQIGFCIGVAVLLYKIICFFTYAPSIIDWWGGMILLYFFFYITSIATIYASIAKKTVSIAISITMMVVSAGLLVWDGIMFLGFAASLNGTPMKEMGIMPFVNFLHLPANLFILLDSIICFPELRIPFDKIRFVKNKPSLSAIFKWFNILDLIAIAFLCFFLIYLTDGKEHAYHGGSFSENKVVNKTIKYLEDRYDQDINMRSSAGPKGDVIKYDDPDRPGRNTYCVTLFWKYEAITAYVELLPGGGIDVYKENFMSRRFSHELEDYLFNRRDRDFPCDINFEYFVSPDHPVYDNRNDFFKNLPDGTCVNIEYRTYDEDDLVNERNYLKRFVKNLPNSLEGNFVIGLYHHQDDGVYTTISIPYAHNSIYFDRMTIEDDSYFNRAIAMYYSLDTEYVYSEIRNEIEKGALDPVLAEIPDFDRSLLQISDPVTEYIAEGWDDVYFSRFRNCYPIAYDGEFIAIARLTGADEDFHYRLFIDDIPRVINECGGHDIAFLYDPEWVYVYDALDDGLYFAGSYVGEAADRFGPATRSIDEDRSTDEIENEGGFSFSYVKPVNIEVLYSLGY